MKFNIEYTIAALQAISEGYAIDISDGYIIVRNPDALKGTDPNLVIDLQELFWVLRNSQLATIEKKSMVESQDE